MLALILCFFAIALCPAQTEDVTGKALESTLLIATDSEADTDTLSETSQPSTAWLFVRMVLVLALVVLCIYVVVFFLKKGMTSKNTTDPYLKVVASITLSPGKFVYVISIDDKAYIIGVTDNYVNLIGQIENKELIDAMNLNADSQQNINIKNKDFASILSFFSLSPKKKSTDDSSNFFGANTSEAVQNLQRQRERLNKGNVHDLSDSEDDV
ncbi:MAG: flagellar biosynthetic protein FliO [Spirochaetaceae bacterium]|nr:flagellar biosynthetic protein FliO [Spirochaetaceae bacterium]